VSLVGAIGAALGLEWISPRLRTSAQVERALGLRPVVVIPDLRVPRGRRLT
jgi:tyrosine-protein kinase Etk/Wzc